MKSAKLNNFRKFFGLEGNILVLLGALVLLGLGEELWGSFVTKYLEALGAGAMVWSGYRTLKNLVDTVYQYPGGVLVDKIGHRRALVLFNLLAIVGYVIYLLGAHWIFVLIGTVFVAAWGSMSQPAIFAVIGDSFAEGNRSIGFSVQSIVKRAPIVVAPIIGGWLLENLGIIRGFRVGVAITIVLALGALVVQQLFYRDPPTKPTPKALGIIAMLQSFDPGLRQLLVSDILARLASGLPDAFIVIYATTNLGASVTLFGTLYGLRMLVAILMYLPAGKLAARWGQGLFVALTFTFFALFPLVMAMYPLLSGMNVVVFLVFAFIISGLKEIGEPARKAMIVDLAGAERRGEAIGAYYLVRSLSVAGGPMVGGVLWKISPQLMFTVAAVLGLLGLAWYIWRGPK